MAILEKRHFYSLETLSFYLEQKETQLLGPFLPKTLKNKISIFRLKLWVNPFRKIINTATLENNMFLVCKAFLSILNETITISRSI